MFFCMATYAQDWQCLKTDRITFFSSDSTNIRSIRIDSIINHSDTIDYICFKMLRENPFQTECFTKNGDSWMGKKFRVLPNGNNVFYNKINKPIYIKTKAQYGETWFFYSYTNSNSYYIEAKISSIDTMNIFGVNDSIKIISLQLKDSNNNNVNYVTEWDSIYIINTSQLILSKTFGLVQIIDFLKFPINNIIEIDFDMYGTGYIYKLIGITNPPLGYKNITSTDIFDFDINDEIHTQDISSYSNYYPYGHSIQKIEKYISKITSENEDTITYTIERCYYTSTYDHGFIDSSAFRDTILFKFIKSASQYNILNSLSGEPSLNGGSWTFNISNLSSKYYGGENIFEPNFYDSTCLNRMYYDPVFYNYFYKGLGGPFYHYYNSITQQEVKKQIVYYKKGTVEFGSPYDCNTLLYVKNNLFINNCCRIFPNPTSKFLHVETIQNTDYSFVVQIENIQNKKCIKQEFINNTNIDISSFSKGMYIVKIFSKTNFEAHKIIIE